MARKVMVNGLDIGYIPPSAAADVTYDNTTSGIRSTNVQGAISELAFAQNIYSTTERVVGKWVDGSLIYRKSFPITSPQNNTVIATIADISEVIKYEAFFSYEGTTLTIPSFGNNYFAEIIRYGDDMTFSTNDDWTGFSGYLTVYYLKEEDTL